MHILGPLEILSLMLATLCHDCDHPGLNNSFLGRAMTKVASLHKKSTLENHHLLQCMAVLSIPECDILINLTEEEVSALQIYIRDLILATDLALHGIILRDMGERKKRIAKEFQKAKPSIEYSDMITVMCCMMKCSDISNEIRPRDTATKWAGRINQEFFAQVSKEKTLNLQVTAFMDPSKIILAKEQMNFINGLCLPLYNTLASVFPAIKVCIKQMESNCKDWEMRFKTFYSMEEQAKASNASIWKEAEVKGSDLIQSLSQRMTGGVMLRKASTKQKK